MPPKMPYYSEDILLFIHDNYEIYSWKDLADKINKQYDTSFTDGQIRHVARKRFGAKRKHGSKTKYNNRFSDMEIQFVFDNYKKYTKPVLLEMIKEKFNSNMTLRQLGHIYTKNGLKSGIDSRLNGSQGIKNRFKKGHVSATSFLKGHTPKNKQEVGTIILRKHKGKEIKYIKRFDEFDRLTNWQLYSHYVYEQQYGKTVSEDMCVVFLDGDENNYDKDNLMLVNRGESAQLSKKRCGRNIDITRAKVLTRRIELKQMKMNEKITESVG